MVFQACNRATDSSFYLSTEPVFANAEASAGSIIASKSPLSYHNRAYQICCENMDIMLVSGQSLHLLNKWASAIYAVWLSAPGLAEQD